MKYWLWLTTITLTRYHSLIDCVTYISAEVPGARRIKGKVRCIQATVALAINNRADVPKSLSKCVQSTWDTLVLASMK